MNPRHPSAPLVEPATWLVWRRAEPTIRVRVTARTAYQAWEQAGSALAGAAFGECECSLEEAEK